MDLIKNEEIDFVCDQNGSVETEFKKILFNIY